MSLRSSEFSSTIRVVRRVGDRRRPALDGEQDSGAADGAQQPGALQFLGDGDRVHRLAATVERGDRLEDVTVRRLVEIRRHDRLNRICDGLGTEQHGPEERLLSLQIVGRNACRRPGHR